MPSSAHALFIPYPAQGHVLPLLELAYRFADHGFAVTFLNTDHIHGQLVAASPELLVAGQDDGAPPEPGQVRFVSVSDGVPPDGDRNDLGTLTGALMSTLPAAVEHMIQNGQFHCMVVDFGLAWVLGVAQPDSCLPWLDAQPDRSVVYVAFGSITMIDQEQFHELARGLELSGRRFLWVVRPGLSSADNYPDGFVETVEKRGKIVRWSPQHKVLAHPAVACFVTHCGWNSVMEGVRNGLPFLTWPYFADQFVNESYVCDVWKTGLRLVKDTSAGLVMREHIAERIENLLSDPGAMSRALELRKVASSSIGKNGMSFNNLTAIINAMKG